MGAVSATVAAAGLTPPMATAASSQTYFIGFPDWLPVGEGATLPSDPVAINNAMVGAQGTNPLIALGLGAVNLQPVWLKYVDRNPLCQPAYDAACERLSSGGGDCFLGNACRAKAQLDAAVRFATQDVSVP
jgi:hypothetical protein